MLTTINKHRQAHHRASGRHFHIADSWCCFTWATYHPNPPKDTLLFLLSMVPIYSPLTPIRLPLPPHCLSCIVPLCLCFSISQSLFLFPHSLMCISLSLKWFHSPPSFSPFVHVYVCDSLGFSHLLCHSLTSAHNSTHVKKRGWRRKRRGAEQSIYLFIFKISFSLETLWAFCLLEYRIWNMTAW